MFFWRKNIDQVANNSHSILKKVKYVFLNEKALTN